MFCNQKGSPEAAVPAPKGAEHDDPRALTVGTRASRALSATPRKAKRMVIDRFDACRKAGDGRIYPYMRLLYTTEFESARPSDIP